MNKYTPPHAKPEISVIVPCYNGEKYLSLMVDSILQQTYKDFELLLIDDGSTDASAAMIDEYAKSDERVKAYHKPNGGLSDARNYGLDRACGKYIVFADCDDYMYPDNLEVMHKEVQGFDLLTCKYVQGSRDDIANVKRNEIITVCATATNIDSLRQNICDIDVWYMAMCWNKMYLRSVIEDNHLRFRNMKSEDEIWSYEVLNHVSSAKTIDYMGLCYLHNPGSLGSSHKAIPEMDWFLMMDRLFTNLYNRLQYDDSKYTDWVNIRFIMRISAFLRKGYFKDTFVKRKERLKRWREARQLSHRLFLKETQIYWRHRYMVWILNHKLERLLDPILLLAARMFKK